MKMFNSKVLIFLVFTVYFVRCSEDFDINLICQGMLFNAVAHPYNRNLFIGCVQGRGTIFGCENEDDIFDSNETKCTVENSVNSTTDRSTTPDENEFTNIRFVCPPSGNGFIPHQLDCTRYFECILGVKYPKTCLSPGDHYDVISKECLPSHLALCASIIRCS